MTNVHGISVSGGSFPAEIWRRFMDPALARLPAREFPEPTQPAVFHSWQRGPWSLSYDPYYVPPAPAEPTTSTDGATTSKPEAAKPATPKPVATPSGDSTSSGTPGPSTNAGHPAEP